MAAETPETEYVIRSVLECELDQVRALLRQVPGWDCYDDSFASALYKLDPDGCLTAATSSGKLLSICLSHRVNDDNGRIARFVTDMDHRRKGIGHKLFTKAMEYLHPRNISLDALDGQVTRYESYGFNISSFRLIMFKCKANYTAAEETPKVPGVNVIDRHHSDFDFDKLVEYDAKIHTYARKKFLQTWLPSERANMFVALNESGCIMGYVGFWKTLTGHRLMPMFADTVDVARMLWSAGIRHIPRDSSVEAAVLHENKDAIELTKTFLFILDDYTSLGTTRMYNVHTIDFPLDKVFAATDYDFSLI